MAVGNDPVYMVTIYLSKVQFMSLDRYFYEDT
jgi:hypothetical protein